MDSILVHRNINCGHCKGRHQTIAQVRLCAHRIDDMVAELQAQAIADQLEAEADLAETHEADAEYWADVYAEAAADRALEARAEGGAWWA